MPRYRVGDKVSIEYTVRMSDDKTGRASAQTEHMGSVFVTDQHGNKTCIPISEITSHTPAPWEPKVGDDVVYVGSFYKIVFIDDKTYITDPLNSSLRRCIGARADFDKRYKRA